jgi:hypothetical protein
MLRRISQASAAMMMAVAQNVLPSACRMCGGPSETPIVKSTRLAASRPALQRRTVRSGSSPRAPRSRAA